MSSAAKIAANRSNAQKSTGPKTSQGRAKSSTNSITHGLTSSAATIFAAQPAEIPRYDALRESLFKQCLPEGELELQTFERFVFATFQADRARCLEVDIQDRWLRDPDNPTCFQQLERSTKLAVLQERRADSALKKLGKLQSDRILALDIQNELYAFDKLVEFPASLPMTQIRRSDLTRTSPGILSLTILSLTPEARALVAEKAKQQGIAKAA